MRSVARRPLVSVLAALFIAAPCFADEDAAARPRPAEIAARASSGLLLDVTQAGSAWIAVGDHGLVLRSEDSQQWKQIAVPVDTTLNRVRFLDAQRGWIVGYDGCVLQTQDGGRSWTLSQFDADAKPFYDVLFLDENTGWLAGSDGVLKRSSDGGASWQAMEVEALTDGANLYAISRLADGSLLLAGERGFLAHSADAGQNWSALKSPYAGAYFGILPAGAGGALVFGLRGNAFHADDLSRAIKITAADREAQRIAADDPESSARDINPVSVVAGWVHLTGSDNESLFGGTRTQDGRTLVFGNNGRIVEADLAANRLRRLPSKTNANFSAGVAANDGLIVVGTSGLRHLPLEP